MIAWMPGNLINLSYRSYLSYSSYPSYTSNSSYPCTNLVRITFNKNKLLDNYFIDKWYDNAKPNKSIELFKT